MHWGGRIVYTKDIVFFLKNNLKYKAPFNLTDCLIVIRNGIALRILRDHISKKRDLGLLGEFI